MKFLLLVIMALPQLAFALNGAFTIRLMAFWTGEVTQFGLYGSILTKYVRTFRFNFSSNSSCQVECDDKRYDSNGNRERLWSYKYIGSYSFSNEVVRVNAEVPGEHVPMRINTDFHASYSDYGRFLVSTNLGSPPVTLVLTGWRNGKTI